MNHSDQALRDSVKVVSDMLLEFSRKLRETCGQIDSIAQVAHDHRIEANGPTTPPVDQTGEWLDNYHHKALCKALGLSTDGERDGKPVTYAWGYLLSRVYQMAENAKPVINRAPRDASPTIEKLASECSRLRAEIEKYQAVCAATYQCVGAFDGPVRFLDALSDAANGAPGDAEGLLPIDSPDRAQAVALSTEQRAALDLAVMNLKTHGDDQLLAAVRPLVDFYECAVSNALVNPERPICHECGDSIMAHDPGVCGTCYSVKYAGADKTVKVDESIFQQASVVGADVYEQRRSRLQLLVNSRTNGSVSAFATSVGYSPARILQFLSPTYNAGRSIGERAARGLELEAGLPYGWFDVQPEAPADTQSADRTSLKTIQSILTSSDTPYLAVRVSRALSFIDMTLAAERAADEGGVS